MHALVQAFEKKQIAQLSENIQHPKFKAGDTLKVVVNIEEGAKKWVQTCEGICISLTRRGLSSSFVIRRIDTGGAVEMRFALWAEGLKIHVVRRGKVRRAKLYYLRNCSRKAGRIKELAPGKTR